MSSSQKCWPSRAGSIERKANVGIAKRRAVILLFILAAAGPASAAEGLEALTKRTSCLIEANSVIKLSSQSQGILAKVNVRRGDTIQAQTIVAELESAVERAMLHAAQLKAQTDAPVKSKAAELAFAEQRLTRQQQLVDKGISSASPQTLEDAQTRVAVARSELVQAELDRKLSAIDVERLDAILERRLLRSPVDGVVAAVDMHPGEFADSATTVATIAEIQPLKVEVYLPTAAYPAVRVGMHAEIRPQEPIGGAYVAEVVSKDAQIDAASGLFQIQLRLQNPGNVIPAGLRCSITFLHEDQTGAPNR
jgi:RND family efflux transporter MFP subunit